MVGAGKPETLVALSIFLFLVFFSKDASADAFTITERTEYGITENMVYVTLKSNLASSQLGNMTISLKDSILNKLVDITKFYVNTTCNNPIYDWVEQSTPYKTLDWINWDTSNSTNSTPQPNNIPVPYSYLVNDNETSLTAYYARDKSKNIMVCNWINLTSGNCVVNEWVLIRTDAYYCYQEVALPKVARTQKGVKDVAVTNVNIPAGTNIQIMYIMKHPPAFNINISKEENEYNITVASPSGMSLLDPTWYNGSWSNRYKLTFKNTPNVKNALVNFTVLVNGSSSWFDFTKALANGNDVVYVDADDTTQLYFDRVNFTTNVGFEDWVRVPQIDAGSSTDFIYLYTNNPSATKSSYDSAMNAWNGSYKAVIHFNSSVAAYDVTPNRNHGDYLNTPLYRVNSTCPTTGCIFFQAANQRVDFGANISLRFTKGGTIMTFIKGTHTISWSRPIWKNNEADYYLQYYNVNNLLYTAWCAGGSCTDLTVSYNSEMRSYKTNLIASAYNGSSNVIISNGTEIASLARSGAITTSANRVYLSGDGTRFLNGMMDEIRLSDVGYHEDWLRAENASMTNQFITYGTIESSSQSYSSDIGQPITLNNQTERNTSIFRNPAQAINASQPSDRNFSLIRNFTQFINASSPSSRLIAMLKNVSDAFTWNSMGERMSRFFRTMTDAITANAFIARLIGFFKSLIQALTISQSSQKFMPPWYSQNSTNSTLAGTDVEHRLYWTDEDGLSGYVFQFCNGTWNGTDCGETCTGNTGTYQIILNDTNKGNVGDASVNSLNPNWNFGIKTCLYVQDSSSTQMRAYLMWNLSVIPNSVTIVSAYQKLYTVGGANVGNPFMIGVYNTSLYNMTGNGPWVEGTVNGGDVGTLSDLTQNLTWKNQPYNSMTLQNTTRPSMATGTYEFNITNATISTYANSTNKNMSILMKGVTETNNTQNRYCFYSKELGVDSQEPQLVITYQTYQICTGGWVNDTWTPITGTGNWSNVTKTVNSTVGVNVSWCFYANDTLGMWNHSCSSPFEYITTTGAQFYSGNVTASITIENFASRFGVLARNAMQSLGIDAITTRINAFFVTIYDLLTMNALASRLVAFVRSIVQAVTANAFISKAMSLFRAFGQEIAFNPDASAAETGYPEYWGNSTNSTVVESDIEHRLGWNDTVGMSGYVFQFCEGVWNGTDCPCAVEP